MPSFLSMKLCSLFVSNVCQITTMRELSIPLPNAVYYACPGELAIKFCCSRFKAKLTTESHSHWLVGGPLSTNSWWTFHCVANKRASRLCHLHHSYIINPFNPLTPTVAIRVQHFVPDRVKPSFVIFDIRALWRSGLSVRVPWCQKLQMTA